MADVLKNIISFVSNKFPSIFLKYLRNQLKASELKNSSLYEIAKVAHRSQSLDDLYKSIHENISKLMYADNIFIAIHNKEDNLIEFPYYIDLYDDFAGTSEKFSDTSLTCNCIHEGIPVLFNKRELLEFSNATITKNKSIVPQGTISEYWLGCPLTVGKKIIGAIVVQSYDKSKLLTHDDKDLLNFVSELVAIVIEKKRLEDAQKNYQVNLENKIRERTKELFFAKEKAESAAHSKSEFLANMSHELRTPLNAIIGFCEILTEDAKEAKQEGVVNDLEKIHKSGTDLLALINDILDLSKIEVKKVDLNISKYHLNDIIDTVKNTLEPYAKINNNIINISIPEKDIIINSDELKIRQILFNLLTNACKNSENNTVNLTIKLEEENQISYIVFEVEDFGVGISPASIDSIFEPFEQGEQQSNNKIKGTGLGLTITKNYAELLGGRIKVNSIINEGSIFTVYIMQDYNSEIFLKNNENVPLHINEINKFPKKGKVLVIDDDINFLDLAERNLSKEGYLVFTANNGSNGIEKAKDLMPDVIILDIIMPDIDGWTVYDKIKKIPLLSQVPIIISTIGDYKKMADDFGIDNFLSKPIIWSKLNLMLEKYKVDSLSKHIMVVDDDLATRTILRKMLIKDGWRVDEAINGKIALKRIEEEMPELILLDLLMPVMDGFTFLNEIKKKDYYNKIPIIVITSKDLSNNDLSFLNNSVDTVIQKGNYNHKEIITQVNKSIKNNKLKS